MDAATLARLDAALQGLAAGSNYAFTGTIYRLVTPLYANSADALSGVGGLHASGRFNFRGAFRISYTGLSLRQAEWEFYNTARNSGFSRADLLPITTLSANATLSKVLDLTRQSIRRQMNVTKAALSKGAWDTPPDDSLTQAIGRLAHKHGFEAIKAPSQRSDSNLNLLPDNYLPGSSVNIIREDCLPPPPTP